MSAASDLPVVFLMGPTASGKTDLAMAIADVLPVDLISVDSAMIYRGMDIGTAKPAPELLARYPHALVDILDPAEAWSVADFCSAARARIEQARAAGRIPLLVGGTMMYFNALRYGLADLPPSDPTVRSQLEDEAATLGLDALHERLRQADPGAADKIHPKNRQRLLRALEILVLSGKAPSELWQAQKQDDSAGYTPWDEANVPPLPYTVRHVVVAPPDRQELHERIARRFVRMLDDGLVAEVESLFRRGDLHPGMPSIRCVGYRQVWSYLSGEISREDMIAQGVVATRQLAKRQFTWLRKWPVEGWLDGSAPDVRDQALKIIGAVHTSAT